MSKNYVLDTSAIFTLTKGEDGSNTVENILTLAGKGKCTGYVSFASFMEIYYITWMTKGESAAKELSVLVKSLPLQRVDSNERSLFLPVGLKRFTDFQLPTPLLPQPL